MNLKKLKCEIQYKIVFQVQNLELYNYKKVIQIQILVLKNKYTTCYKITSHVSRLGGLGHVTCKLLSYGFFTFFKR